MRQVPSRAELVDSKNRLNLLIGLILTNVVTLPTLVTLVGDLRRPSFSPQNAWFWLALCCLLALGLVVSLIGLLRGVHWGHFAWSQAILSFLVFINYIGWYRRELDYARMGPDPDAIYQGPPVATWSGLLLLVMLWLLAGFLPLALWKLKGWVKARRNASKRAAPG